MSAVFADTSFYVALLNPNDRFHQASRVQTQAITGPFITTEWVLLELANYLSRINAVESTPHPALSRKGRGNFAPQAASVAFTER